VSRLSNYAATMEHIAQGFEGAGVAVLIGGGVWSAVLAVRGRAGGRRTYLAVRQAFGGALLLALEILVAADLIRTTAVQPTLTDVAVLGLIVLIRTFLSFSLDIEISGRLPWRRSSNDAPGPP